MKKSFDPSRLDVAQFAKQAGELQGEWRLTRLTRLTEAVIDPEAARPVAWSARGELFGRPGHAEELWLALQADAEVGLACQRCLQAMPYRLTLDTRIRFVQGEDAAERLDAEIEEDVLALTSSLDLRELVEDELLLALPIVPRHEVCPEGARPAARDDEPEQPQANPFAVLRQLRPGSADE